MQQGVDSRAMLATFITKLPVLIIMAVAGAVLGSGLNLLITLIGARDTVYVSETEYYITFAEGQYEAKNYYNAFTWNDALATDMILGRAMELLGDGYDRAQVRDMIAADIFSDVRYLTVTVRGQEPAQIAAVRDALRTALEEFGRTKEGFTAIDQIEDLDIVQEKVHFFVWQAAFLGALIAGGTGAFVTAFGVCQGSAFYTKRDISERLGLPVYGLVFDGKNRHGAGSALAGRQSEMLEKNLRALAKEYHEVVLMDASKGQYAAAFLHKVSEKGFEQMPDFRVYDGEPETEGAVFVAVIPFGKTYREAITDEMDYVRLHGGRIVAAVLTQADFWWMRIYYAAAG